VERENLPLRSKVASALVLAAVVLPSARALAQDEAAIGTFGFSLDAKGKKTSGTATIRPTYGGLVLEARAPDGDVVMIGHAPVTNGSATRVFVLAGGIPTTGISAILADAAAASVGSSTRSLEVAPSKLGNLAGVLKDGATVEGKASFTRRRAALIVHNGSWEDRDERVFHGYAVRQATYYAGRGYVRRDLVLGNSWEAVIAALLAAGSQGRPYDRVVFIGHGGWDGPMLIPPPHTRGPAQASGQLEPALFARFADAVKRGTTLEAKLYFSGCHSGGSNFAERKDGSSSYIYADDLAKRTGRTVAGPAGETSTEFTLVQSRAALEGEGNVVQETRIATGAHARTIYPAAPASSAGLPPPPPPPPP
jgi:hypothetical protein